MIRIWLSPCSDVASWMVCDKTLATSRPGIYAGRDIASWPNLTFGGARMRTEHWLNASAQGRHAARTFGGESGLNKRDHPAAFADVPYFWSDQYGRKLQMVGSFSLRDAVEVSGRTDDQSDIDLWLREPRAAGCDYTSQRDVNP